MRPVCVHCGKGYANRQTHTEWLKWKGESLFPKYEGNQQLIEERLWRRGRSPDEPPVLFAGHGERYGMKYDATDHVGYRVTWDGESWYGGCAPFCTNKCAINYARKAFKKYGTI